MKTCPFCAEAIQDAAIVCKHCGRSLVHLQRRPPRWGRIGLLVTAVLTVAVLMLYCGADHQAYLAFDARRQAWHVKCDQYVDRPVTTPEAKACETELKAMMAYGKSRGW